MSILGRHILAQNNSRNIEMYHTKPAAHAFLAGFVVLFCHNILSA